MMRLLKTVLILLMITLLFGCSKNNGQNGGNSNETKLSAEYPVSEKFGEQIYTYRMFEIPVALGYPLLSTSEIRDIKPDEAHKKINTYADLLNYWAYSENASGLNIFKAAELISEGEYEDVGFINLRYEDGGYDFIYIKTDGKYYPMDASNQVYANTKWLSFFADDTYVCDDLDDMIERLSKNCPVDSTFGDLKEIVHSSTSYRVMEADDGREYRISQLCGMDMFSYATTRIPVGLGFPKLSDEEIDDLIESKDYERIKKEISTIADLANYMSRSGFMTATQFSKAGKLDMVDVGNIHYSDDHLIYTASPYELLLVNEGQCTATSTLFNALLKDDYEECGYIFMATDNVDGHFMMYFKNDGMYYFVNPASFTHGNYGDDFPDWLDFYSDEDIVCSKTLDGLMNEFVGRGTIMGLGLVKVVTYEYDGPCLRGDYKHDLCVPGTTVILPTGADAKVWTDNTPIDYSEPKHSISETEILGLQEILDSN